MALNDDVMRDVIPFMPFQTLHEFAKVSSVHQEWVTSFLDITLNAALKDYVVDPAGLRSCMRIFGAVISGSFALSFLMNDGGQPVQPADLDLYVPLKYATRVATFLIHVEGYVHESSNTLPYGRVGGHSLVMVLKNAGRRIDVVASINQSALYPISHFWASHLMNYISADSYCVAYPELTFARRSLLSPFQLAYHRYPSAYILSLVEKYKARGFDFKVRPYAWQDSPTCLPSAPDVACPRFRRFFGDRKCSTGSLSAYADDRPRGLPSQWTVTWWRGGDACGEACDMEVMLPERRTPGAVVLGEASLDPEL